MFDIGFPELLLIGIVALLVIGPDKLPETVRTLSLWVGRFRRSFSKIRQEIENEIGADEIKAQLYNESIMQDIEKSRKSLEEVKSNVNDVINDVSSSAADLESIATKNPTKPKSSKKPSKPNPSKPLEAPSSEASPDPASDTPSDPKPLQIQE